MEVVEVNGLPRPDVGKKATKAVRKEERIPCVLYGGEETVHFSTTHHEVRDLIFTPDFKLGNIKIDGKEYRAIVKDIQWHPVTDEIIHIDFLSLVEGVSLKVQVPIHFTGTSPGVKNGGK